MALPKTPDKCPRCGEGGVKRRERMIAINGGVQSVKFRHVCGYRSEAFLEDGSSVKSQAEAVSGKKE